MSHHHHHHSPFSHLKHKIRHATHAIQKTTDKAGDAISKAAANTENAVVDAGKNIEKGILTMPADLASEIKHQITHDLNAVIHDAQSAIKTAESTALHEIEKAGKEIKDELENLLEKGIDPSAKQILEMAAHIAKTIAPSVISVQLSMLSLEIENPADRIEHFLHYAENPPHNRHEWIQFIKDCSPSSLSLCVSVGFALFVESSLAEISFSATWRNEDILDNIDAILSHANIS